MLSPELTAAVKPQQRVAVLLWLAMAFSVVIYGVVVYLMQQQGVLSEFAAENSLDSDTFALLRPWAEVIAVVVAAASLAAGPLLLSTGRIQKILAKPVSAEKLASVKGRIIDPRRLALLQALEPDDLRLSALAPQYLTTMLIRLALAEAITIFGFVLTLLGGDPAILLPFAGATLLLMLPAFPRMPAFLERAQETLQLMPQQ